MNQLPRLPEPEEKQDQIIPDKAALDPDPVDPESKPLLFSFEKYNKKECGLDNLEKGKTRAVLRHLKNVGLMKDRTQFKSSRDKDVAKGEDKPVEKAGAYKKLFKGLQDDVEVREKKFGREERLFYFILGRTFYLLAISSSHYDTDKIRR